MVKKNIQTMDLIKLYKCNFDNCIYESNKKFCMEIHIMDHLNYKPYMFVNYNYII